MGSSADVPFTKAGRMACVRIVTIAALLFLPAAVQAQDRTAGTQRLTESRSCSGCAIVLTPDVTLGPGSEAAGGVTWASGTARDSRGRYYVTTPYNGSAVLVFDSAGRFLQTFGREGSGPGEYRYVNTVIVGRGDTLHVFDERLRRWTVVGPDYKHARTVPTQVPVRTGMELAPGNLVVSADYRTRASAGLPLHRLGENGLHASFGGLGSLDPITGRPRPEALVRQFIQASDTTFWTAHGDRYTLQLWTSDGTLLRTLSRQAAWFLPAAAGTLEAAIRPVTIGLQSDSSGLLWLLVQIRDREFGAIAEWGPEGAPGVRSVNSRTGRFFDLYDSMIEVIDIAKGDVIASRRIEDLAVGFAGPGRVVLYHEDAHGRGRLQVNRYAIDRHPRKERSHETLGSEGRRYGDGDFADYADDGAAGHRLDNRMSRLSIVRNQQERSGPDTSAGSRVARLPVLLPPKSFHTGLRMGWMQRSRRNRSNGRAGYGSEKPRR